MEGVRYSLPSSMLESLLTTLDLREVLSSAAEQLGSVLSTARVVALLATEDLDRVQAPVEWADQDNDPSLDRQLLKLVHHVRRELLSGEGLLAVSDCLAEPSLVAVQGEIRLLGVRSLVAAKGSVRGEARCLLVAMDTRCLRTWRTDEIGLIRELAGFLAISVSNALRGRVRKTREVEVSFPRENTSLGRLLFDSTGKICCSNPAMLEIVGLDEKDLYGTHVVDLLDAVVTQAERSRVVERYRMLLEKGPPTVPISYSVINRRTAKAHVVVDCAERARVPEPAGEGECWYESLVFEVSNLDVASHRLRESEERYRRLVEHSEAIIFHTDRTFSITFISSRALDFFGVSPEDFTAGVPVQWFDLVHAEDRKRVQNRFAQMHDLGSSVDEEFRIINHVTGRIRWLLVKLVPVFNSESGALEGWDGFGIDITARREAQEALDIQSKKVRALYTVSSAIRGYLDPTNIASRGVAALCEATGADAGLCYLYQTPDKNSLSLIAHYGFSADFAEKKEGSSTLPTLSSYVARNGQSVVVADIRNDPRASRVLAEEEGMRSAVLVPISVEDERLGTLGLFSSDLDRFDGGDVMLVSAAANQIGLAARQADLFFAYRKQTKNLAALYRMSRELSRFFSLEELLQKAFEVIRDELGLKRLWLGLLNETGTRIIGQGAYGPGWKRRLVQMNVEIGRGDNPLAQAVATAQPMVVDDAREVFRGFGVKKFFSHLEIKSVVLVPLVSDGQVLGILAVQPAAQGLVSQEEITLMSSLAAEIATVLQAKRLEERIGGAEKMRTVGLLAAGIAHNFNNLLQAILGQASLLKIQRANSGQVEHSADIISEAATKGAGLVKQLLSFANLDEPSSELCDVNAIIERGESSFKRLLKQDHRLILSLKKNLPRARVDSGQLLRILNNLVLNAVQAMPDGGIVQVFTDTTIVDRSSPQYEVPVGTYVRVGVRDNGIGMDAEVKRRCFEPFFTTKNVDPSSGLGMTGGGLGLAVAYALARRNGGLLVADSRPGRGSLFTLYVPVVEAHQIEHPARKGDGRRVHDRDSAKSEPRIAANKGSNMLSVSERHFVENNPRQVTGEGTLKDSTGGGDKSPVREGE